MVEKDPRRLIPSTDVLLSHPQVQRAADRLSPQAIKTIIHSAQQRARRGDLAPQEVESEVVSQVEDARPSSMRRVRNGTGVIIHTNLGRAPLSESATAAVAEAAGYTDVEMDVTTGRRSRRGEGARRAVLAACPAAEDALIVNNGAAALALASAALVGTAEMVISRGELIEIGAGFRLPELMESTGAQLREVGTTNRTHLQDYASAVNPSRGTGDDGTEVAAVLKIHPSNYRLSGFTSSVSVAALAALCGEHHIPLIYDIGSGLLEPDAVLPEEPDLNSALTQGADLVIASGDKLLGGPQAGLLVGKSALIATLANHPLARALRTDKLTLAALEATLNGAHTPVESALHMDAEHLRNRTENMAAQLDVEVLPHEGRVGGGGGAGVPLPGWALRLPEEAAAPLRTSDPPVLTRSSDSMCLLDLRCIPQSADAEVLTTVQTVLRKLSATRQDRC